MSDIFSKQMRSRVMARIKSKGNSRTELRLVNIFRRNRFSGWRRHPQIPGNPDFVIFSVRLAIFVDGCFWHGCPRHGRNPTSNVHYWLPKLERTLRKAGFASEVLSEPRAPRGLNTQLRPAPFRATDHSITFSKQTPEPRVQTR